MGFFGSSGLGIVGNILNDVTGITGSAEQQYKNQKNLDEQNRAWQEHMSNTAYQRQVADMRNAGINPIMAALSGGGASTPVGGVGSASAGTSGAGPVYDTAKELYKYLNSEKENKEVDTVLKREQANSLKIENKIADKTADGVIESTNARSHAERRQSEIDGSYGGLIIRTIGQILSPLSSVVNMGLGINSAKNFNRLASNDTARTFRR